MFPISIKSNHIFSFWIFFFINLKPLIKDFSYPKFFELFIISTLLFFDNFLVLSVEASFMIKTFTDIFLKDFVKFYIH